MWPPQWDWQTRHWQYLNQKHDRYVVDGSLPTEAEVTFNDVVNFRDKQTSFDCPQLHYLAETKYLECEALRMAQKYVDLTPQLNHLLKKQSYARAMSTSKYEACLVGWGAPR